MTDWTQVWTQIIATPVVSAIATAITATAVVKRQSLAHIRLETRTSIRQHRAKLRQEANIWLTKRQYVSKSIADAYYEGYRECGELLETIEEMGIWRRRRTKKLCRSLYGKKIVKVAETIPFIRTEIDEIVDKISYTLSDSSHQIETTYVKGQVLREAFSDHLDLLHPAADLDASRLESDDRGLVNIFRTIDVSSTAKGDLLKDAAARQIIRVIDSTKI